MENTFFNVNDVKQLITAAKKNNVEITISWYEDRTFITISPLMEQVDDSAVEQSSEERKLEEMISNYKDNGDSQSIVDKVLDAMCSVEFADEKQASYALKYMHYVLHTNGTVVSDKFFDYLGKTYDEDKYVMWHTDECGDGKYKLDRSTIPQPSPIFWNAKTKERKDIR